MTFYTPTLQDLICAHSKYLANEPRDLFYKVATELISLISYGCVTEITVPEAVATLLLTWNRRFFLKRKFREEDLSKFENIYNSHKIHLDEFRQKSIESYWTDDFFLVKEIFDKFESILGAVGAAKSLHLLCPKFFPLWDNPIANGYKIYLGKMGTNVNGGKYCDFIEITKDQYKSIKSLNEVQSINLNILKNILKVLDEFNYCKYTRKIL